ncbi:MAG: hypothetical protein IPN94_26100 [Sphingobacteriales bacterium]|nr:hypothetical protein [Sphingobacteriales bacterium]
MRFTAREQRVAKVGANNERNSEGFAALWNNSLSTKEQSHSIIAFLQFNELFLDDNGNKQLRFLKHPTEHCPSLPSEQAILYCFIHTTPTNRYSPPNTKL